jgi:hypothetical protein
MTLVLKSTKGGKKSNLNFKLLLALTPIALVGEINKNLKYKNIDLFLKERNKF